MPADVNISLTPPPGEQPRYRIQRDGKDIPPDELPMQYAIAHRTHIRNDIEILRADGTVLYIQNDVEPLYDANGEVSGCVSVCVDLTEQKRAERQLLEADRTKDEFLATLSHELRNPLAPIRNALEVLRRAGHDPRVPDRAYAIMERQLQQLVRLTDDLLDVSRITRNRIELRRERIDLRLALQSAIETTQPLIDAAGHVLTHRAAARPDLGGCRLRADGAGICQSAEQRREVHRPRRPHHASALGRRRAGRRHRRPTRASASRRPCCHASSTCSCGATTRPTAFAEASGIGLTLAKRLIELHEGTIEATSEGPGRGTTFVTRLPLAAPMTETPPWLIRRCGR